MNCLFGKARRFLDKIYRKSFQLHFLGYGFSSTFSAYVHALLQTLLQTLLNALFLGGVHPIFDVAIGIDALFVGFELHRLELGYLCGFEELLKHTALQLSRTLKEAGQILQAEQPLVQNSLALLYLQIEVGELYIDVSELIVKTSFFFVSMSFTSLNTPSSLSLSSGKVKLRIPMV